MDGAGNSDLGLPEAARLGAPGVAARLGQLASCWLPSINPEASLAEALAGGFRQWPDQARAAELTAPVLYPLLHTDASRVGPGQFCEIADAAYEALRGETYLRIVAVPLGRAPRMADTHAPLEELARAYRGLHLPVDDACSLDGLPEIGNHLIDRARENAFTRRARDLPDLLVAAAADAVGAGAVYLAQGVVARRSLSSLWCVPPLCTLYGRNPFADPPPEAKQRPAGSDPPWFLAFTSGLVTGTGPEGDREILRRRVRERVAYAWNQLRASNLATSRPRASLTEPTQLRLTATTERTVSPRTPVVLPLFGSAQIASPTAALVETTATVLGATRLTLVVDDLNPRYLYVGYDVASVRDRWTRLAASSGCSIRFLSDTEPSRLAAFLLGVLHRLTGADLLSAAAPGLTCRSRGSHTGYDAVHLATMALAADNDADAILAVRGANLPAARRFARLVSVAGLAVVTGLEAQGRHAIPRIAVDRTDLRGQLTSGMAERADHTGGGVSW